MASEFDVNIRTAIIRIQGIGLTLEKPWLISLFSFKQNPSKFSERKFKWRVMPRMLILPRGISHPRSELVRDRQFLSSSDRFDVGLEPLRLGTEEMAKTIHARGLQSIFGDASDGPWDDFDDLAMSRPDGRTHLLRSHRWPLTGSDTDVASERLRDSGWVADMTGGQSDDDSWRVSALDLRCLGWSSRVAQIRRCCFVPD